MAKPFVSICIPAYKNTAFLERLLQSVAQQSYKDFEVVLTDDSPDNEVRQLAEKYKGILPIGYYKNTPAAGMPQNWNVCIDKASGEWIKMMHDDDWFTSANSLQQFVTAAKTHRHCSFIFSACYNVDLQTGKKEAQWLTGWRKDSLQQSPASLVYHNVIGHPSVVMHKKGAVRYDPSFKWLVDVDFYLRYLTREGAWHYIPEPCVSIGITQSQLSAQYYKNPAVEIPEYFSLQQKHGLSLRSAYVFYAFWLLVKKFRIKEAAQIRQAGYRGTIPDGIEKIIACQQRLPRLLLKQTPVSRFFMQRCFRKAFRP